MILVPASVVVVCFGLVLLHGLGALLGVIRGCGMARAKHYGTAADGPRYELRPVVNSGKGRTSRYAASWFVCRRGSPRGEFLGAIVYRLDRGGPPVNAGTLGGLWYVSLPGTVGELGPFWMRSAARDCVVWAATTGYGGKTVALPEGRRRLFAECLAACVAEARKPGPRRALSLWGARERNTPNDSALPSVRS